MRYLTLLLLFTTSYISGQTVGDKNLSDIDANYIELHVYSLDNGANYLMIIEPGQKTEKASLLAKQVYKDDKPMLVKSIPSALNIFYRLGYKVQFAYQDQESNKSNQRFLLSKN